MEIQDTIFIQELKTETTIGVCDWEQQVKQILYLDILLFFDTQTAGKTDLVENTIDYAQVSECIMVYLKNHRFQLIETVADKLATLMLENFPLDKITLTVKKPGALPNAKTVGITITRTAS